MSEPVEFKYKPEGKDYTQAMYAFYLADKRTWLTAIILLLLVACGSMAAWLSGNFNQPLLWVIPIVFLLSLVYLYVLSPILVGLRVGRNPKLQSETIGTASSEQLALKNANVDTKMAWDNFMKAVETRHYFLLMYGVNRRMFQFIPKRAFESEEKLDAFRDLLNLYIPGK